MRSRLLIAPAIAAALVLGGCAAQPYPVETVEALQGSVLTVTQKSAEGDPAAALSELDVLTVRVEDAHARGELTDERHADITASIAAVRAQLEALVAAQEQAAAEQAEAEQQQRIQDEAQRIADEQRAAEEAQRQQQEEQQKKDEEKKDDEEDDDKRGPGKGGKDD